MNKFIGFGSAVILGFAMFPINSLSADAASTDGSIVVNVSADGSPLSGVSLSLVADSGCVIPANQVSDANGQATFGPVTPTCSYTVVPSTISGYNLVSTDHTVNGGVPEPLNITTSFSTSGGVFQVAKVDGVTTKRFDNIAAQCDVGWGTSEIRFGRNPFTDTCFVPTPNENQSGFSLNMNRSGVLNEGWNLIGSFVHHNRNIERGVDIANAKWTYTFTDSAGNSTTANRWFGIVVDETFDLDAINGVGCPYDHPLNGNLTGGVGCVDKVNAWPYPSKEITVGDAVIDLRASLYPSTNGVCPAAPAAGEINAQDSFFTAERTDTPMCFYARATPVQMYSANSVNVVFEKVVEPTPTASETPTPSPSVSETVKPTPTVSISESPTVSPTPTVTTVPVVPTSSVSSAPVVPTTVKPNTVDAGTSTSKAKVVYHKDNRPLAAAGVSG